MVFDALVIEAEDLRDQPLIRRKRRLRTIMPRIESRLMYVDHVEERGTVLFDATRERDLEGIVANGAMVDTRPMAICTWCWNADLLMSSVKWT